MMNTILNALDPQTYGLNRAAVAFGICALGTVLVLASKLLSVLHEAGLPSGS